MVVELAGDEVADIAHLIGEWQKFCGQIDLGLCLSSLEHVSKFGMAVEYLLHIREIF